MKSHSLLPLSKSKFCPHAPIKWLKRCGGCSRIFYIKGRSACEKNIPRNFVKEPRVVTFPTPSLKVEVLLTCTYKVAQKMRGMPSHLLYKGSKFMRGKIPRDFAKEPHVVTFPTPSLKVDVSPTRPLAVNTKMRGLSPHLLSHFIGACEKNIDFGGGGRNATTCGFSIGICFSRALRPPTLSSRD